MRYRHAGLLVLVLVAVIGGAVVVATRVDDESLPSRIGDWLGLDDDDSGTVRASGYLEGRQATAAAEMPARVRAVAVRSGSAVGAGDVLLELEDDAVAARLDQAEAAVQAARAGLEGLEGGSGSAQLKGLQEAVDAAGSTAVAAERDWLAARSAAAASPQAVLLESRYEVAKASLDLARARLELAQAGASPYQVLAAEAGVGAAEARWRSAHLLADRLTVRAPITGTVTMILVRPGESVTQAQPLARVTVTDPLDLVVYVPETALDRVEVGQPVEVNVDGVDQALRGQVVAVAAQAEFTPRNVQTAQDKESLVFAVTIRVPNADGRLKPGVPADALIDVS